MFSIISAYDKIDRFITNDMPNSDSDSDSCLMLQLYGTGCVVREIPH